MTLAKVGSLAISSRFGNHSCRCHRDRHKQQSEQDNALVWLFHFHIRLVHNVPPHIGIDYLEFLLNH